MAGADVESERLSRGELGTLCIEGVVGELTGVAEVFTREAS
jgi:hypothetical protein